VSKVWPHDLPEYVVMQQPEVRREQAETETCRAGDGARPLMAATLSERLREWAIFLAQVRGYKVDTLTEAAAELDRREALVAAAEAWAKWMRNDVTIQRYPAEEALLALLPEAD
jgi:hypothetical protein